MPSSPEPGSLEAWPRTLRVVVPGLLLALTLSSWSSSPLIACPPDSTAEGAVGTDSRSPGKAKPRRSTPSPPACLPKKEKCVYLTFDDGPWELTIPLLRLLEEKKVAATFFTVGQNYKLFPEETAALRDSPHRILIHSWAHGDYRAMSEAELRLDLTQSYEAIRDTFGQYAHCYRPPYGSTDGRVRDIATSLNLREILWDVDPQDWRRPGAQAIEDVVMSTVRRNAIILLHDGGGPREQTLAAVASLIPRLRAQGYTFGRLCER